MELPKVLIWRPEEENDVGHVALKTDKYYVSMWPARYLKEGKLFIRLLDAVLFMNGVEGSLVLNINVDREREGDCDPSVEYEIDVAVTNEDLNSVYEEFLLCNEINPEDVTLKRGEELFVKRQEYDKLSPEQAKKVIEPQQPETSLFKTRYSFSAELLSGNEVGEPFYDKQQSCVSLVFNLLQLAWLKHHADRPIPIAIPDFIEGFLSHNHTERFYRVTWFESVVQKNFISISNSYYRSFIVPGTGGNISVPFAIYSGQTITEESRNPPIFPYNLKKFYFKTKFYLVSFLILALFSYFFPFLRYPVFFGLCVFIVYPFPMIHFVVGLFIMLLSYIYPVIGLPFIFILIVYVYVLYDYYTAFVEMQQPGKLNLPVEISLNLAQNWAEKLGIGAVRKEIRTLRSQLKKEK